MYIITKNGKIDYQHMLKDISRQERRWQDTLRSVRRSSKLYVIARQHLQALKRMKLVCQQEIKVL